MTESQKTGLKILIALIIGVVIGYLIPEMGNEVTGL